MSDVPRDSSRPYVELVCGNGRQGSPATVSNRPHPRFVSSLLPPKAASFRRHARTDRLSVSIRSPQTAIRAHSLEHLRSERVQAAEAQR